LTAQEPGPRGSPQDPQDPGDASEAALFDDPPDATAKTESNLSTFRLSQDGQRGFASPSTNSSNRFSQPRQRYS
jgi:hypothetical protein